MADLPAGWDARERVALDGRWITPGLIDCHTHLVYAGDRAHEFELRLAGASYEEIARAGGGIVSTVKATRAASEDELVAATPAAPRSPARRGRDHGRDQVRLRPRPRDRARMLRAARRLARERDVDVVTTFLGAHALPPEANGDKDRYIDEVCAMIPAIAARTARRCGRRVLRSHRVLARRRPRACSRPRRPPGLPVKLHADQLSNLHGARLAAEHGALSADHLEYADEDGVAAMARAGTVAVLLPGAFYFLREKQAPPVEALRRHGVPIAIATDCNPGTSPLTSLLLTMNMAATLFRLTVDEASPASPAKPRARSAARRDRHARAGQVLRPRHLGHRAAGRAGLSHRLQSAACAGPEGR